MTSERREPRLTRALEDYLETILALSQARGEVRVRDIAEAREVKAGSVSPALRRLAALGLVDYAQREFIGLTPEGAHLARRVTDRHRLLERFLVEVLQVPAAEAEPVACAMEHSLTPGSMRQLVRFLEFLDERPESRAFLDAFHASLPRPPEP
ncbi:MAG: metal-dependent transcriptional regulator [Pseudomonadota bacterium]